MLITFTFKSIITESLFINHVNLSILSNYKKYSILTQSYAFSNNCMLLSIEFKYQQISFNNMYIFYLTNENF